MISDSVSGATAFIGLGGYSYFSGHAQLKAQEAKILKSKSIFGLKSRQAGITSIALSLIGLGVWRLVN
jgi:dipeptide/tripeptide permease